MIYCVYSKSIPLETWTLLTDHLVDKNILDLLPSFGCCVCNDVRQTKKIIVFYFRESDKIKCRILKNSDLLESNKFGFKKSVPVRYLSIDEIIHSVAGNCNFESVSQVYA